MELTFLGTRGGIEIRSRRHRLHSALLVEQDDFRIMIDCGADWLHRLHAVAPSAIVLTHAHADHAAGLVNGAPCPVYAPAATWGLLGRLPILDRRTVPLRKAVVIGGIRFSAIPVQHSIRAPAVGYRVSANDRCFVYLPDVAELPKAADVLRGIDVYIGDGATVRRSMVRRKGANWWDMLPSSISWTGAQRRTSDSPSSLIADLQSCAPPRMSSTTWSPGSVRSVASMYELPVTEIACLFARAQARSRPHERSDLRAKPPDSR